MDNTITSVIPVKESSACLPNKQAGRQTWIDVGKGIAMLCVVYGHVVETFYRSQLLRGSDITLILLEIVRSFYMPLFIMLSGVSFATAYVYTDNGKVILDKNRINRQCLNLGILYIIHSVVYWGIKYSFLNNVHFRVSVGDLLMIPVKSIQLFWYLYVLICLYLFMKCISCISARKIVLLIGFMMSVISFSWSCYADYTVLRCLFYFSFFYLGFFLVVEKKIIILKKVTFIISQLLIFIVFFVCWMGGDIAVVGVIRTILGITASLAVLGVSQLFCKCSVLQYIGKHSLEIYLLHVYFTSGSRVLIYKRLIANVHMSMVAAAILGVICPLICSAILQKIPGIWNILFKPIAIRVHKPIA